MIAQKIIVGHKEIDRAELRSYTAQKEFMIGELSTGQNQVIINKYDPLEYARGVLMFQGQPFENVYMLQGAYADGWITLDAGQEPDPQMERAKAERRKTQKTVGNKPVAKAPVQAQAQTPQSNLRNDIDVLPDDWEALHWSKKRHHIMSMRDKDLLLFLLEEKDEKVSSFVHKRLEELSGNSPASTSSNVASAAVQAHTSAPAVVSTSTGPVQPARKYSPDPNKAYKTPTYEEPVTLDNAFSVEEEPETIAWEFAPATSAPIGSSTRPQHSAPQAFDETNIGTEEEITFDDDYL